MDTPLKKLRLSRGLTGAEVANAIGITQGQYSRIERGQAASPRSAEKLVAFFGIGAIDEIRILYPARFVPAHA
jgi:transcriptional regulator with XRE-family HTH domain